MKCPACVNVNLVMSERQGVEIDYCPNCRGVWLDRGELDKIVEKVMASEKGSQPPPHTHHHPHQPYYKHKKHWLIDLLD